MTKAKQILCIDPEPSDLRIAALLNRRGIAVDMTEVSSSEALRLAVERPGWWDLILCDASSYVDLDVEAALAPLRADLDASLVLVKDAGSQFTQKTGHQIGAADLVVRDDMEHLLIVCEREFRSCATRKEVRGLRQPAGALEPVARQPVVLATINDLSRSAGTRHGHGPQTGESHTGAALPVFDQARIRSLIDAGGLTLEFQPIISLRANEEHRSMFETLVRLKDESGQLLMPAEFIPILEGAGWMSNIDLWIFRRALATLQEMQEAGAHDAVLFINVSAETLHSEPTAKALGAFVAAARLAPGSVVIEVRKAAFIESGGALGRFANLLQAKHHGLLIEDPGLDDCAFLKQHRDLITHIKLDRQMTQGLAQGQVSRESVTALVKCAQKQGMRVIALAVDDVALLPILFSAGVDAIQGHYVSMPHQNLMYPSIQRIESSSAPAWQGSDRSG
jgi:EAL domain-containing protein (putative c-di-GMP-specific phosphodiesterase class I)